jgi:hypothetical protein
MREANKAAVNEAVLRELKQLIAPASPGRVQRGISWPAWMDNAVNEYLAQLNADIADADQRMDRSRLIQLAIARLLSLNEPPPLPDRGSERGSERGKAPKAAAGSTARRSEPHYVPIDELMPA